MKIALTILFSIFALISLIGSFADSDKDTRGNLAWSFVITIIAIVALNIF